ncbi:sigma-70 family RNA polymerase sigma factor [Clostridium beijerinckii]|uniref:Sigma-70 family RNA polymerase sigma factor n=2 Tax=Clostridium beijerinckii TaxID=1520 RepID=A0AB74VJ29_CLOBE|nr:sigma-70 family RNA polymerase sigma factor [Clostridium beijerinckii]MBC2460490.1 sigma-70 family RNA polymerase sigma factor [Clostridium beijerinckii]MBC2477960.1 sigma-70 family RNA polymerase sigma factor [Clostridium beijerinckii]MDG5856879.1 helix-turn-helix domain-containing protein [Clostridium beijerinckii]MZK50647.1 sigma-70 family RNA polymerase sigma factor [Clostridium beijerinckii]MZK58851.1 sigma-70 family RNA polymerase sigma factor [Clostridium beijerinckii]
MNYDYIEHLASKAKGGDLKAKENLIKEFTPLINSLSMRTFIHGYEKCDIKNECFLMLFNCIAKYDLNTHRFVAYATNSIKNNLLVLLKRYDNRKDIDGYFSLSDDIECNTSLSNDMEDESMNLEYENIKLLSAIKNNLSDSERYLINFVFFMKNTLTNYAYHENVSYMTALKRKKKALKKLKSCIVGGNELWELTI